MSFGGGSSGGGQVHKLLMFNPYAPAQGSLNQIISEAGNIIWSRCIKQQGM